MACTSARFPRCFIHLRERRAHAAFSQPALSTRYLRWRRTVGCAEAGTHSGGCSVATLSAPVALIRCPAPGLFPVSLPPRTQNHAEFPRASYHRRVCFVWWPAGFLLPTVSRSGITQILSIANQEVTLGRNSEPESAGRWARLALHPRILRDFPLDVPRAAVLQAEERRAGSSDAT